VVSLTPSTAYDFQIQAVNALGQVSAWSDTVNATTTAALELSAVTESATTRSAKKK
jgi:hypothetical protein